MAAQSNVFMGVGFVCNLYGKENPRDD